MAVTDVGGPETWRALSMRTPSAGSVAISKGDALKLAGAYEVTNATDAEDDVFGEALASTSMNGAAIAVKVRGVAELKFTGEMPDVNGVAGVTASATDGKVKKPASGNGTGRNLAAAPTSVSLTLASVVADDAVTINGLTFTAHADTTTAATRTFKIDGNDTADAVELAGLINDATYGVPGVSAEAATGIVTLTGSATVPVIATTGDATITPAVLGGIVRVLL